MCDSHFYSLGLCLHCCSLVVAKRKLHPLRRRSSTFLRHYQNYRTLPLPPHKDRWLCQSRTSAMSEICMTCSCGTESALSSSTVARDSSTTRAAREGFPMKRSRSFKAF